MSIKEMITGGGITLLLLLSLIQVSPIKVNPWTWIAKMMKLGLTYFGRVTNSELMVEVSSIKEEMADLKSDVAAVKEDVSGVQKQVEQMSSTTSEQAAISARARILRFGDEVLHGQRHSKDHFDSVLRDAKMYTRYCASHPEFENGVTEPTIERIKDVYAERLEKNDFL